MVCCLGSSCRSRVNKHLMKDFKSLSEAEAALHIDYVLDSGIFQEASTNTPPKWIIPEDVSLHVTDFQLLSRQAFTASKKQKCW